MYMSRRVDAAASLLVIAASPPRVNPCGHFAIDHSGSSPDASQMEAGLRNRRLSCIRE